MNSSTTEFIRSMVSFIYATSVFLGAIQTLAQPSAPLKQAQLNFSMNQCLAIALKHNRDVQLTREALVQAEADIVQARSAMLPYLGAEALFTGFDEKLTFAMGPQALTFMKQENYKAGIVLRQPIFTGGRLNAARKAAQYARDATDQQVQTVEEEIVFQVTRAYWTTQVAAEFQKVAAEAVHLLETHEREVAILVREGASAELDLLRTRTELANARKQLNAADNALDLALSALKTLLSIDLEATVSLTDTLGRPPRPPEPLPVLTSQAISQRPELDALKHQVASMEQALKAAKGGYLPIIAAEGRYEYMEGDFRDLEGGGHWTIGVSAQVPIWNWGDTRAKVKKTRSQLEQSRIQLKKQEDTVRLEVREAYLNLQTAEKNINAAETALQTAKEAYRMARATYQAGEGTNTDVLDARTALSRAEANHVQALFEYNVALAALQRAVGAIDIESLKMKEATR